ncbi:hypothetical protein [Sphingobacterium sp. 1.A.4]|uniref:hypothetical protein n=1 Tax=Sphingobacterium sp. 1.A.4 TaxID=2044603 RepID=UPI000C0BEE03|nr:hypothetical protein [Sphingobacterium sp. 1.A.4]
MKNPMILLIFLSLFGCDAASQDEVNTKAILQKLGVLEQFQQAVKDINPTALKEKYKSINQQDLQAYEEKFFKPSMDSLLINKFESIFSEKEISKMQHQTSEEIMSKHSKKYELFEYELEIMYDERYLDAQRLISGVKEIGKPDQANPFAFFTIEKPNGVYHVEVYDSQMPQNSKFNPEPLLPAHHLSQVEFVEVAPYSFGISFQLADGDIKKIDQLKSEDPKTVLALIVDQHLVSIRQIELIQAGKAYHWYSPWPEKNIKEFAFALKNDL